MSRSVVSLLDLPRGDVLRLAVRAGDPAPPTSRYPSSVVAVLPFGRSEAPAGAWIAAASRLG